MGWFSRLFRGTIDIPDPKVRSSRNNIKYDIVKNQVVIGSLFPRIIITTVANTESMNPVIDAGHTILLTDAFDLNDLQVGDIVAGMGHNLLIIHRIKRITADNKGRYFTLKGDNNFTSDPYRYRDADIKYLLLGIIY